MSEPSDRAEFDAERRPARAASGDDAIDEAADTIERPALPRASTDELDTVERPALPRASMNAPDAHPPLDPDDAAEASPDDAPPIVVDRRQLAAALPAVLVEGPSEAFRHPAADRCPYCLTFIGLGAARRRGVRFCPLCGADWQTIGRRIEAPSGAVIPFGEEDPPLVDEEIEEYPTAQYTRRSEPVLAVAPTPAPVVAAPVAAAPSPWLMLAMGLFIGLAGTLAVAWWARQGRPDPATVTAVEVVAPAPRPAVPVTAEPVIAEPVPAEPVAADPIEPMPADPIDPIDPMPTDPIDPMPTDRIDPIPADPIALIPTDPRPTDPRPTPRPTDPVSADDVQAALLDTAALMPPSELVDVRARVEGDIVFLDGLIGSNEALGQIVAAVAGVAGVRAVDSRGVRPATRLHTVAGGDTLARLGRLYYGDPNAWPRIYDANREIIDRPDRLVPGMKLRIPRVDTP